MKTDVVVHSAALTNRSAKRTLSEGSSVYVRIIKKDGNNSYTAAFGGGRFSIKSELPLKPGMGFFTTIMLENNRIVLQQQNVKMIVQDAGLQKINSVIDMTGRISDPKLISYFERIGLIPDEISLSLYNQMRNLGIRFERALFIKARAIGMKFKGREKNASIIAYLIECKGLQASEKSVEEIMSGGEKSMSFSEDFDFSNNTRENPVRDFFKMILNGEKISSTKEGVVTLFNHLGFSYSRASIQGNWIKIPFEFSSSKANKKAGNGSFCGFLNSYSKILDHFTLSMRYGGHIYGFAVFLKNERCCKIIISSTGDVEMDFALSTNFKKKFPDSEVFFCRDNEFCEFYTEPADIGFVNGVV